MYFKKDKNANTADTLIAKTYSVLVIKSSETIRQEIYSQIFFSVRQFMEKRKGKESIWKRMTDLIENP